ncbi:MAG: hypothetical protein MAG451_02187 [Anaerolineales bacterium]|nr:hypothetical protein [Anaerolineales bacterium]
MVEAVNTKRRARGLAPYRVDVLLRCVAQAHSDDMVRRGYFGHVTPEGTTLWDRLEQAGLSPRWAGENIQRNSRAGVEAVDYAFQWFMDSTLHRNNILHQHYTHIGVGVVQAEAASGTHTLTTFTLVHLGRNPSPVRSRQHPFDKLRTSPE